MKRRQTLNLPPKDQNLALKANPGETQTPFQGRSRITPDFCECLAALASIYGKKFDRKNKVTFQKWLSNTRHQGLNYEMVAEIKWLDQQGHFQMRPINSVRLDLKHRALGLNLSNGDIIWFWAGQHKVYDELLRTKNSKALQNKAAIALEHYLQLRQPVAEPAENKKRALQPG